MSVCYITFSHSYMYECENIVYTNYSHAQKYIM